MRVSWEALPGAGLQSLRCLDLSLPAFAGPLHAHEALELTWIRAGRGLRFVGETVEAFGPGDLVLLPPRAPHAWSSSGRQRQRASALVLQLQATAAVAALPEWGAGIAPLLQQPAAGWKLEGALADEVRQALLALAGANALQQLGIALFTLGRIAAAAGDATALRPLGTRLAQAAPDAPARRRVDRLLQWIRRHLHTEIHAAQAAEQLHVTPAAFSRAFKRRVGKPFSEYVNDLRIAEACLALGRSDRPVAEIAAACGYTALSNFNAQFQRRHGVSPRAWRRAAQGPALRPPAAPAPAPAAGPKRKAKARAAR